LGQNIQKNLIGCTLQHGRLAAIISRIDLSTRGLYCRIKIDKRIKLGLFYLFIQLLEVELQQMGDCRLRIIGGVWVRIFRKI
jgi:hypothetical protein